MDDSKREWKNNDTISGLQTNERFSRLKFPTFPTRFAIIRARTHTHSRASSFVGDDKPAGVDYTTRVTSRVVTARRIVFARAPPTGGA